MKREDLVQGKTYNIRMTNGGRRVDAKYVAYRDVSFSGQKAQWRYYFTSLETKREVKLKSLLSVEEKSDLEGLKLGPHNRSSGTPIADHECPVCYGRGGVKDPDGNYGDMLTCRRCQGSGFIRKPQADAGIEQPCPYTGIAYSSVPGYVTGYGCPVCKAIGPSHLTINKPLADAGPLDPWPDNKKGG